VPAIGILVNNAGMSIRSSFWDVTDDDWDYQVNVNVRSPFILAQHMARHMISNGTRGRIVNISTIGVHGCHRNAAVYNLAKGAVESMTKNMGFELGPYGITVNCVAPGNMALRPGASDDEPWFETAINTIPVGRLGNADDIAAAVRFFCSPEASFTTGQTLLVDGAHNAYLVEALPAPVNDTSNAIDPRSRW
jgi:NAD(P)-dependent dehydrogenase (short-subunit alcohol dehydrogenase family)